MVHGELIGLQRVDGDGDRQAGNHCLDGAGTLEATLAGTGLLLHGTFSCLILIWADAREHDQSLWSRRHSSVYLNFVNTTELCGYLARIDTHLHSPYYLEHYDTGSYAPLTVHGGTHHHGYTQIHFEG